MSLELSWQKLTQATPLPPPQNISRGPSGLQGLRNEAGSGQTWIPVQLSHSVLSGHVGTLLCPPLQGSDGTFSSVGLF